MPQGTRQRGTCGPSESSRSRMPAPLVSRCRKTVPWTSFGACSARFQLRLQVHASDASRRPCANTASAAATPRGGPSSSLTECVRVCRAFAARRALLKPLCAELAHVDVFSTPASSLLRCGLNCTVFIFRGATLRAPDVSNYHISVSSSNGAGTLLTTYHGTCLLRQECVRALASLTLSPHAYPSHREAFRGSLEGASPQTVRVRKPLPPPCAPRWQHVSEAHGFVLDWH